MSAEVTVLSTGERTLSELAAEANREHALAIQAAISTVGHAIKAGEALLALQPLLSGQWVKWLTDHWDADESTARCYMRIAFYRDRLDNIETLSVRRAEHALRGLPPIGLIGWSLGDDSMRERALQLRAEGMSDRKIAYRLNIGRTTVRRWVEPGYAARENQRAQRYKARLKRERREAEKREQIEAARRAARTNGRAIGALYASAERMQDEIAQAHREAGDTEARAALSLAGEHYRKMRDEIVRALGVS